VLDLSQRDREICDLLLQACSNREIARRLSTSEAGVKQRLAGMFRRNQIDPCRDRRVLLALVYYGEKIQSPAAKKSPGDLPALAL
jgi:DNA-binding NarL/FixJ family response regulator